MWLISESTHPILSICLYWYLSPILICLPGDNSRSSLSLRLQGLEGSAAIVPPIEGLNKRSARSLHDKWLEDIKHPLAIAQNSIIHCRMRQL